MASKKGFYGDSSCYTFLGLNEKIFNQHLLEVLNKNFAVIMIGVKESIQKEARILKKDAIKELNDTIKEIDGI